MNIVLFTHARFVVSQSMPRFAAMLHDAFVERGHQVQLWTADAKVHKLVGAGRLSKWAGYIDQYLFFPMAARKRIASQPEGSIYVFCDQALGPWVPLVRDLPHVVHCHDFLALRSALGEIPENPTSLTGRIYQRYIRRGFRQARNFISISGKTKSDLVRAGGVSAELSTVVYNGLNFPYRPETPELALGVLLAAGLPAESRGMLLHVGGGQWYKNTRGVIAIYREYASRHADALPLWIIGPPPKQDVQADIDRLPKNGRVLFFRGLDNKVLQATYSLARAFLFPSLAEGFGWPIIEAQACGCPVITTDEAPMNEIGGPSASYLPRLKTSDDLGTWAARGADLLDALLHRPQAERVAHADEGIAWARRFDKDAAIDAYLRIYQQVLQRAGQAQLTAAQGEPT